MTERLTLARWTLEVDRLATHDAYSIYNEGDCERCGCMGCLNYIASRSTIYPDSMAAFLRSAGIPADRELGVGHYGEIRHLVHLYTASFHFVGRIIAGVDAFIPHSNGNGGAFDLAPVTDAFSVGVTSSISSRAASFPAESTLALEFSVELPWLLDPELSA